MLALVSFFIPLVYKIIRILSLSCPFPNAFTPEEESSSIENWEMIKSLKTFSSIDFTLELLKEAPFELVITDYGEDGKTVETLVDDKKISDFIEAQKERIAEDEKKWSLIKEKTELILTTEFSEGVDSILREVECITEESGLAKERFIKRKGEFKLKTEVVDSDKSFQGWFMCQEAIKAFEGEERSNELRIGVKGIRQFASALRMKAGDVGIILDKDMSVLLALFGTISHEYGHYMEHVEFSGPNFTTDPKLVENAHSVNSLDISFDDYIDEKGLVSERLAQGVASLALEKKIGSMNLSIEQKETLRRLALGTDPENVDKYRQVIDWAKQRGLSTRDLSKILLKLHFSLKGKGLENEAELCMTSFDSLGYYTEPYTPENLITILNT